MANDYLSNLFNTGIKTTTPYGIGGTSTIEESKINAPYKSGTTVSYPQDWKTKSATDGIVVPNETLVDTLKEPITEEDAQAPTIDVPEQPDPRDVEEEVQKKVKGVVDETVDIAQTKIDKEAQDLEDKRLKDAEDVGGLTAELEKSMDKVVNKDADLHEASKTPELDKELQNVINEMRIESASLGLGINAEQNRPTIAQFSTGKIAAMKNSSAARMGALAATAQVLEGNIALAKKTAEDMINAQYAPLEQEIANQQEIIALNYQNLTATDKIRADKLTRLYKEKETQIANEKEIRNAVSDVMLKAAENGASRATLDAINNSTTEREAIYNAGDSLAKFATDDLLSPNEASTLGVPYGTTQSQAAAMGVIPNAVLTPEDKIKQEYTMSGKVDNSIKESKKSVTQINIMNKALQDARNAEASGETYNPGSQGVLVTFQKMLDPTSVVRESEYARSSEGLSVISQLEGKIDQWKQGGAGVPVSELENFVNLANGFLTSYQDEQVDTLSRTRTQADNWGLNIENIITPEANKLLEASDATRLNDYYKDNPNDRAIIDDIVANEPGISDYDIMRVLGQGFSQSPSMDSKGSVQKIASAIGQFESGGNYKAIGPEVTSGMYKGDTALGKYQIMGLNIPSWSKEALGYSITKEQFLNSPELQDKIAEYKMSQSLDKYGNVEDVASVWFSGQPVQLAGNRSDVLGTTVPQYVKNIVNNYNNIS